jgi:ABC-type nickel/cobalt efflux system permease component RcnA
MLGAITLQRVGFGLLLIVVFSLGLASVLSLIGVALVKTRTLFDRIPTPMRLASALPMASAVFITILGIGVTWQALLSTGILS